MSRFVKVKYVGRYTQSKGNDLWLNLDNIIAVDEHTKSVYVSNGADGDVFMITDETMPTLIEALENPQGFILPTFIAEKEYGEPEGEPENV